MGKSVFIVLIVSLGLAFIAFLFYKSQQNKVELEKQRKIQALTGSLNQTNTQQGGLGGFFNSVLGQTFGFAGSQGGQNIVAGALKLF